MTATASTVRATGLYRRLQHESRAAAADPIELVTMLYDELETAIGVLGSMVRQGQRISATEPAHRARAILINLQTRGLAHLVPVEIHALDVRVGTHDGGDLFGGEGMGETKWFGTPASEGGELHRAFTPSW